MGAEVRCCHCERVQLNRLEYRGMVLSTQSRELIVIEGHNRSFVVVFPFPISLPRRRLLSAPTI